jgi:hypothetical protein
MRRSNTLAERITSLETELQRAGSAPGSRVRFLRFRLRAKAAFTRFFSPGFK